MRRAGWLTGTTTQNESELPSVFDETALVERASRRVPGGTPFGGPLAEVVIAWNRRLGASPEALEKAAAVARGEGLVVVTGQQPSLFGGPLYSLYKYLTVCVLAARLERRLGTTVLPVFWVVGDDSDFGEVSSAWVPSPAGKPIKVRDPDVPAGGTRIGALPSRRQLDLLDSVRGPWQQVGQAEGALREVASALESGRTWSGAQASLFYRLLPNLPGICIDGDDPTLLAMARSWLATAGGQWPIGDLLRQGAGEARDLGHEPVFEEGAGERVLFRIEGARREPLRGTGETEDLLAPNVVLRPLLQDWLLPNIATVGGPSEIRYRAQLGPLYRHAGIPEPIRLPRMRAILVPELPTQALEPLDDLGGYQDLVQDPAGWIDRSVESTLPADLLGSMEAVRRRTGRDLLELGGQLKSLDASLLQMLESARGKIDYQFERLTDGVKGKARHRWLRQSPRLPGLSEFLRPRGREQERVLSLLTPFLMGGPGIAGALAREAWDALDRIDPETDREGPLAVLVLPLQSSEPRAGSDATAP